MKRIGYFLFSIVLMSSVMVGCSGQAEKPAPGADKGAAAKPSEPITLKVLWSGSEDSFNDRVNNPIVKQKLPNVTFEFHSTSEGLEKLIVSGVKLDVINVTTKVFFDVLGLNLNYDMTDLIKKQNFDLSRFVPEHLEISKMLGGDGKMYALPDKANFPYAYHAMVYNKDIFDKFGVPYPKDHMTWDEVITLAKRLNRTDNGVQYLGLGLPTGQYMYEQLALNYTDKKGKVDISNPLYSKIFRIFQDTYNIIGKDPIGNVDPFMKDKNVAMFAGNVGSIIEGATKQKDVLPNWDIVTFPSFEEKRDSVPPTMGVYMVSSISEHKEEALKLINALLSKENTKSIEENFMNPEFTKKNVNAVKAVKQSLYVPGEFDGNGNSILNKKIREMNKNSGDINTAVREMQEELQKFINENKK